MATTSPRRGPGERAGLDRTAILDAARAQLTELGAAGLTMRGVAARLGVAPNALYSHVASKVDLIDLVLDEELARVPVPEGAEVEAAPVAALRRLFGDSFDVLVTRADLMPHFLARQGARGPRAVVLGEVAVGALARCGLSRGAAQEALRVLVVNTIGFAAFAASDGPLSLDEVRANHQHSVAWLLAGITGRPVDVEVNDR